MKNFPPSNFLNTGEVFSGAHFINGLFEYKRNIVSHYDFSIIRLLKHILNQKIFTPTDIRLRLVRPSMRISDIYSCLTVSSGTDLIPVNKSNSIKSREDFYF